MTADSQQLNVLTKRVLPFEFKMQVFPSQVLNLQPCDSKRSIKTLVRYCKLLALQQCRKINYQKKAGAVFHWQFQQRKVSPLFKIYFNSNLKKGDWNIWIFCQHNLEMCPTYSLCFAFCFTLVLVLYPQTHMQLPTLESMVLTTSWLQCCWSEKWKRLSASYIDTQTTKLLHR